MDVNKKIKQVEVRQADLKKYLEGVEKEYGALTPGNVVESARPEDSPLHDSFEWDNEKAGDAYRLVQARALIRRVYIIKPSNDDENPKQLMRAYVSVSNGDSERDREYVTLTKAMNDAQMRMQVLRNALRDAQAFMAKYKSLKELSSVIGEMEKFVSKTHSETTELAAQP